MKKVIYILIVLIIGLSIYNIVLFSINVQNTEVATETAVNEVSEPEISEVSPEPPGLPTAPPEQTPAPVVSPVPSAAVLEGRKICIDPGHGITDKRGTEEQAPGSGIMKSAHVSGAEGELITEEEFNLDVALKVRALLEENGAEVVMTRTTSQGDLSNIERAQLGNTCDIAVRIHADSSESSSANGISVLTPEKNYFDNDNMVSESRRLSELVLENTVSCTGARNRGVVQRSDMTGFNWSDVPTTLIECGFLSNAEEEKKLADDEYRQMLAQGIYNGIAEYYGITVN